MVRFSPIFPFVFFLFSISSQTYLPEKEISIELTPSMDTNETLTQKFKCDSESNVKELYYRDQFPTKISCNEWIYKKVNTLFNMTLTDGVLVLNLHNLDTFLAHVNGQFIYVQKGPITEGICAGGKFTKLVFMRVPDNACDGEGVILEKSLYASVKIDGGFCQTFCFGDVTVEYSPGITNE